MSIPFEKGDHCVKIKYPGYSRNRSKRRGRDILDERASCAKPAETKLRTQWHAEGTSKGGTVARAMIPTKKKEEREGIERNEGGRRTRRARHDDAIHSRDEGGGIHVSPVIPSSLSQSLVSPALGASLRRFLLPATLPRCANPGHTPDRLETWFPLPPSIPFPPRTKVRENTSVCRLSFISAFLKWHRCQRTRSALALLDLSRIHSEYWSINVSFHKTHETRHRSPYSNICKIPNV